MMTKNDNYNFMVVLEEKSGQEDYSSQEDECDTVES